jgi:hypothetical protein
MKIIRLQTPEQERVIRLLLAHSIAEDRLALAKMCQERSPDMYASTQRFLLAAIELYEQVKT